MADWDPEAYVSEDTQSPDLPVITDSLRPTTYGPGSPNPTPADMRENIGNANNPLQVGDVALQPETAAKYGLKTGDQFVYQGQTYRYADTPSQRVGNVIDIYHPGGEFDPHTYVNPIPTPSETPFPTGVETGTSPQGEFNPQAYLEPAPAEPTPTEERQGSEGIRMPSFAPTPIPQVSLNIPNVPTSPMPIIGARQLAPFAASPIAPIPQPAPTPIAPPPPGPLARLAAMGPLSSQDQARVGLRSAVGALKTMYPVAGQQMDQLAQAFPQVAQGIEDSATNTLQGLTVPSTVVALPLLSVPFVAEAWGATQLAKTPQALSGVADVVKRYGLNSKESASAITGEVTRLAMAGTALHRPLMSMAREVVGTPAFAGKVNESGGITMPESFPKTGPLTENEKILLGKLRTPGINLTKSGRARLQRLEAREKSSFGSAGITRAGEAGSALNPFKKEEPILPGGSKGSGRYKPIYRLNKEVGDKMNALAASPESARLLANSGALEVYKGLSSEQISDLGKYLVSKRLMRVNPDHPQILPFSEMTRISRDPMIQKALSRYIDGPKQEIEDLRERAGLPSEVAARQDPEFVSLVPKTDELLPNAPPAKTSARSIRYKSKTTTHAKKAEGFAKEYETNLATILEKSYSEVMRKARFRDLYDTLKRKGSVSGKPISEIKGQPAVPVDIGRAAGVKREFDAQGNIKSEGSTGLPDTAYVPEQVAHAIKDIMENPADIRSPVLEWLRNLSQKVTAITFTANPPAIANHMRRQLEVAAKIGNDSLQLRSLQALIPYFGPRMGTLEGIWTRNASTPEFRQVLQDIYDANAGSTRGFQQYQMKGAFAKWSKLSNLQEATHKLLFGIPEGEGVNGWDSRVRVEMELNRRAIEGNTDPERIREVSNGIGQYSSKPSRFVQLLRNLNPVAATTVPLRITELKLLLGGSGIKARSGAAAANLRAQTLLRGAGGTIIALAVTNRILSGHYPWENKAGHELDLDTGFFDAKGNPIYAKLSDIDPTLGRAVNTFSAANLLRERTAEKPSYGAAAVVGPFNQAMSLVQSPLSQAAWTLGTGGTVPYLVKNPGQRVPNFLDIAKRGPTTDRGLNALLAAIGNINPIGEQVLKRGVPAFKNYVEQNPAVATANVVPARVSKANVVKANVVKARIVK